MDLDRIGTFFIEKFMQTGAECMGDSIKKPKRPCYRQDGEWKRRLERLNKKSWCGDGEAAMRSTKRMIKSTIKTKFQTCFGKKALQNSKTIQSGGETVGR